MAVSRSSSGHRKRYWRRPHYMLYHSLVWLYVLAALLPFAQMIWTAQKPRDRVDRSYEYLRLLHVPEREVAQKVAIDARPLRVAAINSTIVSSACAVLSVVFCSMAGYAFAKKRFRGRTVLFDLVLAWMALPTAILMMPLFRLTVVLGIYDTLLALILPFCVTGFGIFYMRYAISSVPDCLIDSARVDGLSELGGAVPDRAAVDLAVGVDPGGDPVHHQLELVRAAARGGGVSQELHGLDPARPDHE